MNVSPARRRVLALLRSPTGLRQAMLATEVLQPPIALRQRQPGRPAPPVARTGDERPSDVHADVVGPPPGD